MRMRPAIGVLLGIIVLGSCRYSNSVNKVKADVFTDTLAYKIDTLHKRAGDCGNKPDSSCTAVNIKYPVFQKNNGLNKAIVQHLLNMFMLGEKPDTSLNSMAERFIGQYDDAKKTDPRTGMFYTLDSYARVVVQDSSFVGMETGGYNYAGGAHGGSFTGYINWDIKKNREVKLSDILKPGTYAQFEKIAEANFRKSEKLTDTSSLARDYFFKDNKFALNENFSITPVGLKFMYNQYEIKPYAAGQTVLDIPYTQIKGLLQPGSVAAQFVK